MYNLEFLIGYFDKRKVTSSLHRQIVLFLISGGICFAADLAILVFLVEIMKMNVIIANCISVIFSIYIAYKLNVKFIFRNGKFGLSKEVTLFFVFSGISFLLDVFFLFLLVKYVMMWYVIAKIIVTLLVALFNFSTRKWFIFSN